MKRLDPAALRATGRGTALDPEALTTGIVHLGAGAFYRAHGAVLTEDAMAATGEEHWGATAVTGRSARVREQLAPQGNLFTVTERGEGAGPLRVVSSVRETLAGPGDPWSVVERIADPATRVVTLTVTEKGYTAHPATGRLDTRDPRVRADLEGAPPATAVGLVALGLERRALRDAGPVTVVSCDNLPGNGARTAALVADFAEALPGARGERLGAWVREHTAFPATMVDRMVPATTPADLDAVQAELGLRDEAAVVAEPYIQWVLQNRFAAPRPAWEKAGAHFTDDVRPWEEAKLRVLNAGHSLLAYLGLAGGHPTIAGAAADEVVAAALHGLLHEEVLPTLAPPEGLDPQAYAASVLRRFANPALGHTTAKVASDGSQKLGPRLLCTVRAVSESGGRPFWSALALAAWMRHVATAGPALDDPMADALRALLPADTGAGAVVPALLRSEVFPEEMAADTDLADTIRHWYTALAAGRPALAAEVAAAD